MTRRPGLAAGLVGLAAGLVVGWAVGPAGFGLVTYHVSRAVESQTVAVDLVGLLVVAPLLLLFARDAAYGGRTTGLAVAPAAYTAYMGAQALVGQAYLDRPGSGQRLAPLELALVGGGLLVAVAAWAGRDRMSSPWWTQRRTVAATWVLAGLVVFVVLGRWAPAMADAMRDRPTRSAYRDAPEMFWVLALLDLGVITPALVATAVGIRSDQRWARDLFPVLTLWFALVGASVLAMATVMLFRGDQGSSAVGTTVLALAAGTFVALASWAARPVSRGTGDGSVTSSALAGRMEHAPD
jgi:hypothetical protein